MFANKREPGQRVVKQDALFPAVNIMATATILAQSASMGIIAFVTAGASGWWQGDVSRLFVASFTSGGLMLSQKREFGHRVMVKARHFPVAAIMAFGAFCSVAALVAVIFSMAAITVSRRILYRITGPVTLGTACPGMFSDEGKARILIMIERCRFPRCRRMTACTIRPPRALMGIVLGMTADAGFGWRLDRIVRPVTTRTRHGPVTPQKCKASISGMIERSGLPSGGIVATRAIRSARSSMNVVLGVAANAILWQPFPPLPGMARKAAKLAVRSNQPKAGLGMIERNRLFPIHHRVTGLAVAAKLALVRVILGMAVGTSRTESAIVAIVAVTARASRFGVTANQRIVRQIMIETSAIKLGELRASTMMFAMADFAGLSSRI